MKLYLGRPVRKRRHLVPADPGTWEIDVFDGDNTGLILAEIELPDEAIVALPEWLGEEVTGDPRSPVFQASAESSLNPELPAFETFQ